MDPSKNNKCVGRLSYIVKSSSSTVWKRYANQIPFFFKEFHGTEKNLKKKFK